jgi:carboxyl-terminal processing protease
MKRGPIYFSIAIVALLAFAVYPRYDGAQKESILIQTLMRSLDRYHFNPVETNDEFSRKAFDLYLDDLDQGRRFFTQEDVDRLLAFRTELDDQARQGTFEFFDLSQEILMASLEKTQGFYREILAEPFDFTIHEEITLGDEDKPFSADAAALREYWRKYLKYETLNRYSDLLEEQEKAAAEEPAEGAEPVTIKTEAELEAEAREDLLELYDRWYGRLLKVKREDRLSQYINALTSVYDPHTTYFKPIDRDEFNMRISGRIGFEGIGARLSKKGDYINIVEIIVGGPAWKGKELEENDLITKVRQYEEKEALDIKGMEVEDVVEHIRGKKGTKVVLTVKKPDGTVDDIVIERDVIILEESYAKSLLLPGTEESERFGYIYLPSFYADFEDRNGHFCAEDVATEIEKLQAENVDGIILDLRNNGGGSLREVIKMSGLFIEEGPIVQVKGRDEPAEVLYDKDASVQYAGPLVVLVNHRSASASEILAAALQDYGRAVIVGSNSTFGKGSVQRLMNLDRYLPGFSEVKPLGELKLTTDKYYRINGGSVQLRGVAPDVILPDDYHFTQVGEKDQDYPLAWTEIEPADYDQKVYKLRKLDKIRKMSQERVAEDPTFGRVLENAKRLKAQLEFDTYPLALTDFQQFEAGIEQEARLYEDLYDGIVNPGVINLALDLEAIEADEGKTERNKNFVEGVSKDIYIREAVNILHDMLTLEK